MKSRSRVMSLKERFLNNPHGTRSIQKYLQHMQAIVDDFALVDSPLSKDDLVLYTLASVGLELKEIVAALRARDTPISFDELYNKLGDYEIHFKKDKPTLSFYIAMANYTHRQNRFTSQTTPHHGNTSSGRNNDQFSHRGNNTDFLNSFVKNLDHKVFAQDLSPLHQFLGVEVINTPNGLFLSQHRHIDELLHTFGITGTKEVYTPMCNTSALTLQNGSSHLEPTPYRKLVGALQYLSLTRPDVCFAVNSLSQIMHSPTERHWTAFKRLLRYLKATIHHGLYLCRGTPLTLQAFNDSDWGGDRDNGRSTIGYIFYLGSNTISWKSRRQKSVSRSSSEAEYKAIADSTAEILWVTNLLEELGLTVPKSPALFCDNTGATYLCSNPVFHSRMKHIALDYHFVRECVTNGSLRVHHISTKDQLADILTKALGRPQFLHLRSKIGVTNGASILRGRVNDSLSCKKQSPASHALSVGCLPLS
ncbi:hypothetical protein RJ640_017082 [Escallonia rubra]|uniref:Reverse transcriptase Ty1/copia-type domain-containing protein n=1 Tax=Escallonia rubra TaxID=112253 RepID=A0AA88QCE4_9ASTE|nr:hypothetical protein RJ640_017082 [Escallonia rubra]